LGQSTIKPSVDPKQRSSECKQEAEKKNEIKLRVPQDDEIPVVSLDQVETADGYGSETNRNTTLRDPLPNYDPDHPGESTAQQAGEDNQFDRPANRELPDPVTVLGDSAHRIWVEKTRNQHHETSAHTEDGNSSDGRSQAADGHPSDPPDETSTYTL
jgi:hypothetical protein